MVPEINITTTTTTTTVPTDQPLETTPLLIPNHPAPDAAAAAAPASPVKKFCGGAAGVKYMECQKNHAAAIGGNATDGCGEFMAGGEHGTLEALKCCACNCHRNFHRKIHLQPQMSQLNGGGSSGVLKMKSVYEQPAAVGKRRPAVWEGEGQKRFRTKFSPQQKEKMVMFAERAEWKIQKADDSELRSFCEEIGITRKVLKIWMHNNKYSYANKTVVPINSSS